MAADVSAGRPAGGALKSLKNTNYFMENVEGGV
jgi:hypothetical protein